MKKITTLGMLIIMTVVMAASVMADITCSADSTQNVKLGESKSVSISCTGMSTSQSVTVTPTAYNANCISPAKTSAQLTGTSPTTTFSIQAISLACQNNADERTITWSFNPSSGSAIGSKDTVIAISADSSLSAQFDQSSYSYEEGGDLEVTLTIYGSGDVDISDIDISISDNANLDTDNGLWDKSVETLAVSDGTTSTQVSWTLTDMPPMPPGGLEFNASLTSGNAGSGGAVSTMSTSGGESQINYTFNSGWSLISFPLNATNMSAEAIFSEMSNLSIAWYYTGALWTWYVPGDPDSTVSEIDLAKGYWAYVPGGDTLSYNGSLSSLTTISVSSGWNLVGYPKQNSTSINETLSGIIGDLVSAWAWVQPGTYTWFVPNDPDSPLTQFQYGYGYWLRMTDSGSYNITN